MSINPAYFTDLADRINGAQTCAELQSAVHQIMGPLNAQIADIAGQISALSPLIALATAPTSPTAAVTWITNFITAQILPQVAAITALTAQAAQLTSAIATLTSAVHNAETRIGSCTVTIP